jgi:carbonic anhydrase
MDNAIQIFRRGAELAGIPYHSASPQAVEALERLMQGNDNYISCQQNQAALTQEIRRELAVKGQEPYVILLTCSDSRVPTSHIFSEGLGSLFVIRNAGNLVGQHTLTSAVYAAEHLNVPLLVVMGHTKCGAVASALDGHPEGEGMIAQLVAEVLEALGGETDPRKAEVCNVCSSMKKLGQCTELRHLVERGELALAAAMYDIETGAVTFLNGREEG